MKNKLFDIQDINEMAFHRVLYLVLKESTVAYCYC